MNTSVLTAMGTAGSHADCMPRRIQGRDTIDYSTAAYGKEIGMQLSLLHANSHDPQWMQSALEHLHAYALKHERFAGWMVSHSTGAPVTAQPKAWGQVFRMAVKLHWIEKDGLTQDPTRHMNPVPVWKSRVWG